MCGENADPGDLYFDRSIMALTEYVERFGIKAKFIAMVSSWKFVFVSRSGMRIMSVDIHGFREFVFKLRREFLGSERDLAHPFLNNDWMKGACDFMGEVFHDSGRDGI